MKRLVVDASALVSGVASKPGAPPALLLTAILDAEFEAIISPKVLGEFKRALRADYFIERFSTEELDDIVKAVELAAIVREDADEIESVLRDPDDDYLVALAREAEAEAIVTGDRDLLDHPDLEPPAMNARRACELLGLI